MPIIVTDDQGQTQEICPAACYDGLFDPDNMTQEQIDAICNLFSCGPTDVAALATALYLLCEQQGGSGFVEFVGFSRDLGGYTIPFQQGGGVIIDETVTYNARTILAIPANKRIIAVQLWGATRCYTTDVSNDNIYAYIYFNGRLFAGSRQASRSSNDGNWAVDTNLTLAEVDANDEFSVRYWHLYSTGGGAGFTKTAAAITGALLESI